MGIIHWPNEYQDETGRWVYEVYDIPYGDMPLDARNEVALWEPKEDFIAWYGKKIQGDPLKWPGNWKQTLDESMYLPVETMGNYSIHNTFKNDIDNYRGNLSKSEEDDLFKRAETDNQAKAVLIQEHLGLMYKLAKTQQKKFKRLEFTEMLAASSLELVELITKLIGKERHHRLYTIMHNNIVFAIKNIGKDGIIQISQKKRQDMLTIRKTVKELFLELMEAPSKEDLLQKLNWGESRYDASFIARESMRILKYDNYNENPILEVWDDFLGKTREYNLEELTDWALENILTSNEGDIIASYYGIGEDSLPLSRIAENMNMRGPSVSRAKAKAEAKLKVFFESKNIYRF